MELSQQEHMEVPYAIEGTFLELFEKIPIPPPNDELGQDLFKYPTVLWEASEALQKMALLLRREENKVLFVEEGGLQLLAQVLQFCEGPLAPGDPPGKELLLQRTRKYCMKAVKRFKRELESYKIIGLSDKEVAVLRGAVSRSILLGSARTKEVSDERHMDHLPSDGRALIEVQAAQYANDAVLPQQEAATEEKQSVTDEQTTEGQLEKVRVAEITSSLSQVERRASAEMVRQSTIEKEAGEGIVRKSSTTQQQPQRLKPLPASPLAQRAEGNRPIPPQADSRPDNALPRQPMAHTNEREPIKVVPSVSVQQRASVMPVMGVMPMPARQQASAKPSPFPTAVSAPTPVPLPTTITLAVPETHMKDDEKDTNQQSSAKKKVLIHSKAPLQSRPKYLERESPSTELDALLTRLVQESDIASRYEVVRDHFNYLRVETKNKKYSAKPVVLACTGSALYCIDATALAGVECGWTYDQIHAVRIDDSSLNAPINNLGEELAEPLSMFNGEPLRLICIALQQGGLHHFVEHRRADLKDLLQCINRGRLSIATIKQVQLSELAPSPYSFLQPHGMDLFTNKSKIEPVLEALAVAGFTEQDIWEGNLDLPKVIQQFKETALQDVFQQRDKDYVVIFLLPEGDAFGGLFRKLYRVGSNVPVKKILRTLCNRLNVDPQKYCLTTLSGCPISSEEVLASYGLGSLFENWQLKLIEKDVPTNTGNYVVEFQLPGTPAFSGLLRKALKVDAYRPIEEVVSFLCSRIKVSNPHHYGIMSLDGSRELSNSEVLSDLGLGVKFPTCKLQLIRKNFPLGTDPVADKKLVVSLLNDLIANAVDIVRQRKEQRVQSICQQIVLSIVEHVCFECERANTIPPRIALLSGEARKQFYERLAYHEKQEFALCPINAYKRITSKTKDAAITPLQLPHSLQNNLNRYIAGAPLPPPATAGQAVGGFPDRKFGYIPPHQPLPIPTLRKVKGTTLLNTAAGVTQTDIQNQKSALRTAKPEQTQAAAAPIPRRRPSFSLIQAGTEELMSKLKRRNEVIRSAATGGAPAPQPLPLPTGGSMPVPASYQLHPLPPIQQQPSPLLIEELEEIGEEVEEEEEDVEEEEGVDV